MKNAKPSTKKNSGDFVDEMFLPVIRILRIWVELDRVDKVVVL